MQRLKDLRLAGRLGLGFGALALALVVVAALAGARMNGLGDDVRTLDHKELQAVDIAGRLATSAGLIGTDVVRHLYVFDGDLEAEDRIAASIEQREETDHAAMEQLNELLAGTPAEAAGKHFAEERESFHAAYSKALSRSRRETVDAVEERDGSRDQYLGKVEPAEKATTDAAAALQDKVGESADNAVATATASASSARTTVTRSSGSARRSRI